MFVPQPWARAKTGTHRAAAARRRAGGNDRFICASPPLQWAAGVQSGVLRLWLDAPTNTWLDGQMPMVESGASTPFAVADALLARSGTLLTGD